jgi:glucosamine 6-phosphate synthetase-like amidotransferase/phosphosugar isomerase protein
MREEDQLRAKEERKIQWLRSYSGLIVAKLRTENFTESEATVFLEYVKKQILEQFPDKREEYYIIYERRFKRILIRKGICLNLYPEYLDNHYS